MTLIRSTFNQHKHLLIPCLIFLVLIIAIYGVTISIMPDADDMMGMTTAAQRANPLTFFWGDAGLRLSLYRPLEPLALWVVFKLFGTNTAVNQIINLVLHFVDVCLLYHLLRRIRPDGILAFLLTLLVLVSPYTMSAPMWVSDRPMLVVALATLLFLEHLFFNKGHLNPWLLAGLAIFALLGKENGLTLPALMLLVALEAGLMTRKGIQIVAAGAALGLGYFGLRYVLFHTFTANYAPEGYLLGIYHYRSTKVLSTPMKIVAYATNIASHLIAIILPVFSNANGQLASLRGIILRLPVLLATAVPFLSAIGRRLSRIQRYALALIILNALLFFPLFRFRDLYVEQIAFCIFVMAADFTQAARKRQLVLVCLVGLCFYNTYIVTQQMIPDEFATRLNALQIEAEFQQHDPLASDIIDPQMFDEIAARFLTLTPESPAAPPQPTEAAASR